MKLSKLRIDNFKAAVNLNLDFTEMTALVGVNGSGKTTILEALEHFFRGTPIPSESYRDPNQAVAISVTFADVPRAKKPVTITRAWAAPDADPTTRTNTRGLKISAPTDIIDSVHVIFEHAEHESDSDGTNKSGLDLMRLIKSTIGEEIARADLATLLAQSNDYYQNLGNSTVEFAERMNQKLSGDETGFTGYSPGSTTNFEIKSPDPEPGIEAKLTEHGVGLSHKLAGHGTKRAFRMAALETHAEMSTKDSKGGLVLMLVDEPELHQHPQRLPRILQTYKRMADQPSFQLMYATHAPDLVDREAPGGIYRVWRDPDRSIVAKSGSDLDGEAVRWSTSKSLAEGIFSDGVILVEGPRDRAILDATFSLVDLAGKSATRRFIENNLHVVQSTGVTQMPDFVEFFRGLEIPLFAIWDADGQGLDSKHSKAILEALGGDTQAEANPEGRPRVLGPNYLCFDSDACMYFKEHFGFEGTDDTDDQKRDIKSTISDTPNLTPIFDTPQFRGSEFAQMIVPHIYNSFPKPGGVV